MPWGSGDKEIKPCVQEFERTLQEMKNDTTKSWAEFEQVPVESILFRYEGRVRRIWIVFCEIDECIDVVIERNPGILKI